MSLGTETGLGSDDIVSDGDPPPKEGTAPNFWPMSVVVKRLYVIFQDITWYGSRPQAR